MASIGPSEHAGISAPASFPDAGARALARVLDVEPVGDADAHRFRGAAATTVSARMFGGHAMAQAVLAAGRTVPAGREPFSMHAVMLRPGDASAPAELLVDVVRDGGAYSTRRTDVVQSGRTIAQVSTQWHAREACSVAFDGQSRAAFDRPGPQALPYPAPGVATEAFDLRWADTAEGRVLWFRLRVPLEAGAATHAALAVYISDLWLADTAVRRAGRRFDDRTVRASTLEHGVWLHRPVALDQWCRLPSVAESAADGRAVVRASLHADSGESLATIVQAVSLRDRPGESSNPDRARSVAP